ncbi:hypothetical protein BSL78_27308 [Apostichopus japonicus]|uniref:Uncharacterized protein n=1 Tax=Stichopus japonicus TaxID=307972 RepID=A0A2G8JJE3_STIJA|nr:hypothetical protein BSL78_27308 [Apostichopus japonicus]
MYIFREIPVQLPVCPLLVRTTRCDYQGCPLLITAARKDRMALYQNGVNRKPRNERTSLVRLPSGEYLTPMSPREMSPPPPQNPYGVRNKQRPQSAAYTDEMNNQIYATRLQAPNMTKGPLHLRLQHLRQSRT